MLAATACDFCRKKKKRCSKELPKCSNCVPWPGTCVYSKTPSSKAQISQSSPASHHSAGTSLHESSPEVISSRGQTAPCLAPVSPVSQQLETSSSDQVLRSSEGTEYFMNSAYAFMPVLSLADADNGGASDLSQEAMQALISSFANVQVGEVDEQSHTNTRGLFYTPEVQTAEALAQQVCNVLSYGDFMFLIPSVQQLSQALLNPAATKPRGRVLMTNHILHGISASLGVESNTTRAFSWNVQNALNDSTLFLEPCEENLQALFTLAVHGEDRFACPNLSWMLVGQATQQAKAIGLHLSRPGAAFNYQRRLSLFWSLFVVDKSVSLAFGRPEFLETSYYENVPLPDPEHLSRFNPHAARNVMGSHDGFGPCFFLANVALAKYIGRYNSTIRRDSLEKLRHFRQDLEFWYESTITELERKMRGEAKNLGSSIKEMELGIRTLRFQFLHLIVLLLRNHVGLEEKACAMARMVLSLLPGLVSDSSSVYNGVVWQLLYYPFTSFFVLFRRTVNHNFPFQTEDIQLMRNMVSYYFDMGHTLGPLHKLASKLRETAEVFCRIAEQISSSNRQASLANTHEEALGRFFDSYPVIYPAINGTRPQTEAAACGEQSREHGQMQLDSDTDMDWFLWESHDVPMFPFL